ncbi:peroxiredoxin family protein [Alkaliflexus imshenetskii]|uniref:peroxiredoxin family protein n=1 Tax=Alkaliflexus imshenetskii TaxID=286730 RepID=UPI00047E4DEA|nr:hypothetical protein [Alkaliflexus imshenetskii]
MFRLILTLLVAAFIWSCGTKKEPPLLSGLMWGGEGNRLIVKCARNPMELSDTIIIDHLGEFYWNPDSICTGFYRLEKLTGEGILLVFKDNEKIYVDAQYINFPENVKVTGSPYSNGFYLIEQNSRNWLEAMNKITAVTNDSGWIARREAVNFLKSDIDSVNASFRKRALEISSSPLERMYALLQEAGNYRLFDPWDDRQLFFQVDSAVNWYSGLPEVDQFRRSVSVIRHMDEMDRLLAPGSIFPRIENVTLRDTIDVLRQLGSPLYLELVCADDRMPVSIWQRHSGILDRYKRAGLTVCSMMLDSVQMSQLNVADGFNSGFEASDEFVLQALGIRSIPANFVLDNDGVIVARNVWQQNLEKVLDLLLKK